MPKHQASQSLSAMWRQQAAYERDHQRRADVMLHLIEKGQRDALRRPIRAAAGIETRRADSVESDHASG
jgi:hypothetical protein